MDIRIISPITYNHCPKILWARCSQHNRLLFSAAGRLLKRNGRLYLVHRASRLNELILKAGNHGLQAVRMRIAYGSKTGHARSVLLEMRFAANRELLIEKPVFLDERDTFADEGEEKA